MGGLTGAGERQLPKLVEDTLDCRGRDDRRVRGHSVSHGTVLVNREQNCQFSFGCGTTRLGVFVAAQKFSYLSHNAAIDSCVIQPLRRGRRIARRGR